MKAMWQLEGITLGHYQLQRRLARGGMSEVYLAYDEHKQRSVAIKIVHRSEDEYLKRLQRELKALGTIAHAHILPTLDYREQGPWCYFVMPYIAGGTLRERIAKGPLPPEEAGSILEQVASALQCAHDHGILHRDIKPANIMIHNEQHVYLVDFGLAIEIGEQSDLTQTGCLIGTSEYLAPELTEECASISSDIYAMGIVLYQMLTGRVPFKASTPIATCWKHMLEQPVPPSLLNPTISQPVEQVVLCALEKDPIHRFHTVQAMAQAYKQALQAAPLPQTMLFAAPTVRYKAASATLVATAQQTSILRRAFFSRPHPAMAALVAVFLFASSLSLGFLEYKDGLHIQSPSALGASVVFAKTNRPPNEQLSYPRPTPKPTAHTSITRYGSGKHYNGNSNKQSNGSKHGKGRGHGKGHGHGHGK